MDRDGLRQTDSKLVIAPSTAENYFSDQALRVGLAGINRSEGMLNSDPLRREVLLQREYEKERIREEILRDEIRRRELEAEVRREMAMDREMAIRRGEGYSLLGTSSAPSLWSDPRLGGMMDRPHGFGYGFPERLPLPVRAEPEPFERLPFQRIPVAAKMSEGGNGQPKIIHLAKPTTTSPIVAGTKRKITAIESASESNKASLKKKAPEWNCSLCQVTTTSEDGLKSHFLGKKHKSKEALQIKSNAGKKKNNTGPKNDQATKKQMTPDMKKKKFAFWCEDCQIGCHSETVMENHCKGKKHIQRAGKQAGGSASSTTTTKNDNSAPETTTTKNVITTSVTTAKTDTTSPEMVEDNEDKVVKEDVNEEEGETEVKERETEVKEGETEVKEREIEVKDEAMVDDGVAGEDVLAGKPAT
ncbi:hypothetical protein ACHQM5_029960 [Ranunculus cassubicifolius]